MGIDLTQLAYAQNSYRAFLLSPPPGVGNLWLCSSLQHPRDLTKTSWFVTVDSLDSVRKVKPMLQITQHMPKQAKKITHISKVKHAQLSNPNAEKSLSIATNIHVFNSVDLLLK